MNLIDLENVRFRSLINSIEDHRWTFQFDRFVLFHRHAFVDVQVKLIDVFLRLSNENVAFRTDREEE